MRITARLLVLGMLTAGLVAHNAGFPDGAIRGQLG
jgi:hypothetical protein